MWWGDISWDRNQKLPLILPNLNFTFMGKCPLPIIPHFSGQLPKNHNLCPVCKPVPFMIWFLILVCNCPRFWNFFACDVWDISWDWNRKLPLISQNLNFTFMGKCPLPIVPHFSGQLPAEHNLSPGKGIGLSWFLILVGNCPRCLLFSLFENVPLILPN